MVVPENQQHGWAGQAYAGWIIGCLTLPGSGISPLRIRVATRTSHTPAHESTAAAAPFQA